MGRCYKDLIAWKRGMELVTEIYQSTRTFPREEIYGLTSQLRRAAVSIPSNIAEGQGRRTAREFHQFLGQARGSSHELETQILISVNLGYLSCNQGTHLLQRIAEVGRVINGLMASIIR
ncbi:MAG TPA: four helix bundle protein [Acidobacteriota bacterium]